MEQNSNKKRRVRRIKGVIARQDLPVLNPRDLIDPIAECILDLDPHAEFILMITDPRDHRCMSIRTVLHEPTKGTFMRTLAEGLWPAEEDEPSVRKKKVQAIDTPEQIEESHE
jgi:hypothetical protein